MRVASAALLACVAILVETPFTATAGGGKSWVMASAAPEGSPYGDASEAIARVFEAQTPGLRIKRRYGAVLGEEQDTIRMMRTGRVDLATVSLGALLDAVPELGVLETPYLFSDDKVLHGALKLLDSGNRPAFQDPVRQRDLALVSLHGVGWRNLASLGAPIRRAADVKGLRVRTQPVDVHRAMWRALGAVPVEAPLNGLVEHIRARRIQAVDIPVTFLVGTSSHELVRALTLTRHMPQLIALVASRKTWETLSRDQQQRARRGVDRVGGAAEVEIEKFEEDMLAMLAQRGVTIIRPTAEELATFAAVRSAVEAAIRPTAAAKRLTELLDQAIRRAGG